MVIREAYIHFNQIKINTILSASDMGPSTLVSLSTSQIWFTRNFSLVDSDNKEEYRSR